MKLTDEELTRLAAEGIMGWTVRPIGEDWSREAFPLLITAKNNPGILYRSSMSHRQEGWQPLTDWRAAGEIVERMREIRPELCFQVNWYLNPSASFFGSNTHPDDRYCKVVSVEVPGAIPRAITTSALIACGLITESGDRV